MPGKGMKEQTDMLSRQRVLLIKNMGRAKVDTGYYETMYDRLLRAKQAREGITGDVWEKYLLERETGQLKKLIKSNKRVHRGREAKKDLNQLVN